MAFKIIAIAIALSIHLQVFCVLGRTTHQQTIANISKEEDLELDKQLEILNKPGVESFENNYGDTYDCVPITKQPSLDHPLLKNHTIQVTPSFSARRKTLNTTFRPSSVEPDSNIQSDNNCSEGTVPIRRITKEDLSRTQSFLKNYIRIFDRTGRFFFAGILTKHVDKKIYRGAQAFLTIHELAVYGSNQFSGAVITIRRGPEWIIVGWMVNPSLYGGDKSARAFTMWLVCLTF
ncbi:Nep-interacting protein [Thalictrum thalictroides]|uniref:Nep-interacting protein n=1 Tax=Thalictrum thalictroides TaxID=46969 RepID=A0A7J6VBW7_THATH|nr:Nep-interacting protein [Thalictrum thalictroides]